MKVKRFNNLWAMGLILCGTILVAFYLAKIFFPSFIIGIAETPKLVEIGVAIQSNKWYLHLFNLATRLLDCPKLCPTCYGFLIQQVLGGIPKNCMGMSVGEFADLHPNGTYLIRIKGHLTCVKEPSTVWDIWDCRAKMCDLAWEIR